MKARPKLRHAGTSTWECNKRAVRRCLERLVELSRFAAGKIGRLHLVLKVFWPDRIPSLEGILPGV
jgi:hypothetical protein